ncbi:MAG: hypothetical protein OXI30_10785 [Chloroflexota bacterium]|nr:hypothetical protein [Chloroflexota bacterium]
MSEWGFRLEQKLKQRREHRARRFGRQKSYMVRLAVLLLGAMFIAAVAISAANRHVDWSEPCSAFEFKSARSGERFEPFHVALTQGLYSRADLRRLRKTVWEDLPLCRELVEFASHSLQLYNDLLLVDAMPEIGDSVLNRKEYDRWYKLFLRIHKQF